MGEDKRGLSMSLRSKEKEAVMESTGCRDEVAMLGVASSASICDTINEAMASATYELENNISKQFTDFQSNIQEDIKK